MLIYHKNYNKKRMRTAVTTAIISVIMASAAEAQDIRIETDPESGGVLSMKIETDKSGMNWLMRADGSQYEWVGQQYEWGLGALRKDGERFTWGAENASVGKDGNTTYSIADGSLTLQVARHTEGGDLVETYTLTNTGKRACMVSDMMIHTPWNDNYPDGATCVGSRCHAHIWTGDNAAYVCALRMGGTGTHVGLALTEGEITGYSVSERDSKKGGSNTRGVLSLMTSKRKLKRGEKMVIGWRIFVHQGKEDFLQQMERRGLAHAKADKYTGEVGDTINITFYGPTSDLNDMTMTTSKGKELSVSVEGNAATARLVIDQTGDTEVTCHYAHGCKTTHLNFWGISSVDGLISNRCRFIMEHQQENDMEEPRYGAYLPYDNKTDSLYENWKKAKRRSDLDEGRERLGIGIGMAIWARTHRSAQVDSSITRYARFVRNVLQDRDYKTWSELDRKAKHRIYNYPWVSQFYVEMYRTTGEHQYLTDAYETMRRAYREAGYNFYMIGVPVIALTSELRKAGEDEKADFMIGEFAKAAECYMKNGTNYPSFEVNFEQSIVAPSVDFLCQMYLVTRDEKYRKAAEGFMPVLEAFGGMQPSFHLNDIALRHWDDYWFGRERYWGDTMPHYWSCITAECFAHYAEMTGDESYRRRAREIVMSNLCLLTEDGRGGCAYVHPTLVDGRHGDFLDPMANDQDWVMYYVGVAK